MERRAFLKLGVGLTAGLAGCSATAVSSDDAEEARTPENRCPAVIEVDRVLCPGDDGPVSVTRSSRTVSGDTWALVVAVTNRTGAPLNLNPAGWALFSRTADDWAPVVPAARVKQSRELRPEERYEWQLAAGSEGLSDPDRRVYLDLVAGDYVFAAPLRGDHRYGAIAPFTVTG